MNLKKEKVNGSLAKAEPKAEIRENTYPTEGFFTTKLIGRIGTKQSSKQSPVASHGHYKNHEKKDWWYCQFLNR